MNYIPKFNMRHPYGNILTVVLHLCPAHLTHKSSIPSFLVNHYERFSRRRTRCEWYPRCRWLDIENNSSVLQAPWKATVVTIPYQLSLPWFWGGHPAGCLQFPHTSCVGQSPRNPQQFGEYWTRIGLDCAIVQRRSDPSVPICMFYCCVLYRFHSGRDRLPHVW